MADRDELRNPYDEGTPSWRYFWLVTKLGENVGYARGWKKLVAAQLGVHPSYVSKLLRGAIDEVGIDAIGRAIERLSLDRRLFYAAELDLSAARLRDFQRAPGGEPLVLDADAGFVLGSRPSLSPTQTEVEWMVLRARADRVLEHGGAVSEAERADLVARIVGLPVVRRAVALFHGTPSSEHARELAAAVLELERAVVHRAAVKAVAQSLVPSPGEPGYTGPPESERDSE